MGVLDEVAEDGLVVVANEEDFGDLGYSGDSVEAVLDNGLAGNLEEGLFGATWSDQGFIGEQEMASIHLGHIQRERAETSTSARSSDLCDCVSSRKICLKHS